MPIDATTIISSVAIATAKRELDSAADRAIDAGWKLIDKVRRNFGDGYIALLQDEINRVVATKTIINRDQPVDIREIYVPVELQHSRRTFTEKSLKDENIKRCIVTGIAGSGKSMFMKTRLLDQAKNMGSSGSIPIFIELRNLNNIEERHRILTYLVGRMEGKVPGVNSDDIINVLKEGSFYFLLDGLDEVAIAIKDNVEAEILNLAGELENSSFLVSSRPDERLNGWNEFINLSINPFTESQVRELVQKTDYDKELKTQFLSNLPAIFQEHDTLLQNPLLATMMLLTYDEFKEVPAKKHIFYDNAYVVLFAKHDRMKAGFRRQYKSNLAIDEFKRLISVFCFRSYMKQVYTFSETVVVEEIRKSLSVISEKSDPSDVFSDITERICLLLPDGLQYTFLHRSFQEYFCALYFAENPDRKHEKLIEQLIDRPDTDSVIEMFIEMNLGSFEESYFRSKIKKMKRWASSQNPTIHYRRILQRFFDGYGFYRLDDDVENENRLSLWYSHRPNAFFKQYQIMKRKYLAGGRLQEILESEDVHAHAVETVQNDHVHEFEQMDDSQLIQLGAISISALLLEAIDDTLHELTSRKADRALMINELLN